MDKRIKPNLIDPVLEKRIIKTLNPPKEDYWGPTKSGFHSFYNEYIKPNFFFILLFIFFILFLIYRYRMINRAKQDNPINQIHQPYIKHHPLNVMSSDIKQYNDMLLQLYNQHKELLREPKKETSDKANFAYPMYPYGKGGALISSGKR
jgi:hypothetical protein